MAVSTTRASSEALRQLPTSVRPVVSPADVRVPSGYRVEALLVGLSFPCGFACAPDGSVYIGEGGSTWPTRPAMPARILRYHPDTGQVEQFTTEILPGARGLAVHDGGLYVSVKGGYFTEIHRYDLQTKERTVIVDTMPDGGWHEPGGPIFGPDGLMYFGQGSVSLQGVNLPAGYSEDVAKHPLAHDVPGQDVTLTGNNVWSRDPRTPVPFLVATGPFKPFGVPARKGEVVKGQFWCNSAVWRARPDGSNPELLAWGIRNPYGMAITREGNLYVGDNDFEEKGDRAIAEDPDCIWHVKNAKQPYGSVKTPDWYGFPDLCKDGKPAWAPEHLPNRGKPAEPLIENPPAWAGPAAYLEKPHSCMTQMEFCYAEAFAPYQGHLFACEWGTMAPFNTNRPEALDHGFRVIHFDPAAPPSMGQAEVFLQNSQPGPASYRPGSGGIERPVSCRFSVDGQSFYVLDFGVATVSGNLMMSFAHTGVLWRIVPER